MGNILDFLKPEAEALVAFAKQDAPALEASFQAKEQPAIDAFVAAAVLRLPPAIQPFALSLFKANEAGIIAALNGAEDQAVAFVLYAAQHAADNL